MKEVLHDLLSRIEKELVLPLDTCKFTGPLFELQGSAERAGDNKVAWMAQNEARLLSIVPQKGLINPIFIPAGMRVDDARQALCNQFDAATLEYFEVRLTVTHNDILRSHYAHVLWSCGRRHQNYARCAAAAYRRLADKYVDLEGRVDVDTKGLPAMAAVEAIENAYYLSKFASLPLDETVQVISTWAAQFNPESNARFSVQESLIELMRTEHKSIPNADWETLGAVCHSLGDQLARDGNAFVAVRFYELGKRTSQLSKNTVADWNRCIGITWEMAAKKGGQGLGTVAFCEKAIAAFQEAHDFNKVAELSALMTELRKSRRFVKIEVPTDLVDMQSYVDWCKTTAKTLDGSSMEEVLEFLASTTLLIPHAPEIQTVAREPSTRSILWWVTDTRILDERGNTAQNIGLDEYETYHFWETYRLSMESEKRPLLRAVFDQIAQSESANAEDLMNALAKFSWIFQGISITLTDGRVYSYKWNELIEPLFKSYFAARRAANRGEALQSLILFIDSGTIKIEGMLRQLGVFLGIEPFLSTRDHNGKPIQREKDIDTLLREPKLAELLGDDLVKFLGFVLVEQAGYKLRHKVAHALMLPGEYHAATADLIFLSLLRLCAFQVDASTQRDIEMPESKLDNTAKETSAGI